MSKPRIPSSRSRPGQSRPAPPRPGPSKPGPSKPGVSKPGLSKPAVSQPPVKKFQIPALSIPIKEPPLDPALERLKKKTVRRNAPAGEDIKKIREIIKGLNKEVITVQEFVALVAPHTGDNGNVLRSVMVEDLASFRKLAKKVYDTMTQDVSDVLANEQITVTDYFNERYTLNMDKMMRTIDEIFRYVPNFDFEIYYTDPDYLNRLYPLPKDELATMDPDELAMQKRQEVYHRLQWMRSEGVRLNEENTQLQARLKQLKKQQKQELMNSYRRGEEAEQRRNELEAAQEELQNRLEDLNQSMEQGMIQGEEEIRLAQDTKLATPPRPKPPAKTPQKRKARKEAWNVKTAKSIEDQAMESAAQSAASTVSVTSVLSKTGAVKKVARPKIVRKKPVKGKRDISPFHYSPPRSPPQTVKQTSPFHYSPPKSPVGARAFSPPPPEPPKIPSRTVRYENTTTVVEQLPPEQAPGRIISGRRNLAPRDTWKGFQ